MMQFVFLKEVSSNSRQRRDDRRKVPQVDATAGTQGGVSVFWSGSAERSFGQLRARKWSLRRPVAAPTVLVHRGYLDGTVPGFIVIARAADPDLRDAPPLGFPRSQSFRLFDDYVLLHDYILIMFCNA